MPNKSCLTALLALAFLAGQVCSQEFLSSSFGESVSSDLSSNAVASPNAAPASLPASGTAGSKLVRPALYETSDGVPRSVQQTGYAAPADESPMPATTDDVQPGERIGVASRTESKVDSGFPTLAPPRESRSGSPGTVATPQGLGSVVTVISSLAIVLGLFFITAWLLRRAGPGSVATLSTDVFEVLGRAPLNNRQQVHLIRCGAKLLLVSVTPDGAETLTEIDDPDEVTRMAGLCKSNQSGSATAAFRQVLHQFAGQPADPGFVGRSESQTPRTALPSELENLHG